MIKKKLVSGLLAVTLFMVSCSSDEAKEVIKEEENQTLRTIKIITSGFSESIVPIAKSESSTIKSHISRLRYFAYDKDGVLKDFFIQDKRIVESPVLPPDPFGTIELKLLSGQYTLVVLGEEKNEDGNYGDFEMESAGKLSNLRMKYVSQPNLAGDLFLRIQTLVIGNNDIDVPVRLDRTIGQVMININENIPVDAAKIEIALINEGFMYYFGEDRVDYITGSAITHSFDIKPEEIGVFYSKNLNVLQTGKSLNIKITCKNSTGEVIASKTVNDIMVSKNSRVTLTSDNFFSENPVEELKDIIVGIDPSWGINPIAEEIK